MECIAIIAFVGNEKKDNWPADAMNRDRRSTKTAFVEGIRRLASSFEEVATTEIPFASLI